MKSSSAPLFDKIKTSKNLPTLPHILLKLIETCNNQDSTITDISKIIDKDSSLSAKVMRMVNSVHYGLPIKITNVEQALLLLGTNAIKNIAVSAAVFQVFGAAKGNGVFDLKSFWSHSLLCAAIAELIARRTGYDSPEEAFLSGLLHDIGKMVLWVNFPKEYAEVLQSASSNSSSVTDEQHRFGSHHAEVGAWMIGKWNLQSFMADAVLFHHESVESIKDALPLVKIVFVANVFSLDANNRLESADETGKRIFGFSPYDVTEIISRGKEQVEQIAQSLGLELITPLHTTDSEDPSQKEIDLLRNIRDVSLLQGTLENLLQANSRNSILFVVKQGLQVLFDMDRVIFLLYNSEEKALLGQAGMDSEHDILVKDLAISMESKKALAVQCLLHKTPLDSFGHLRKVELSILDRQLIRLLKKDGLLCLPLIAHANTVGVMLLGVDKTGLSTLCNQMNLLNMFVNQSALALYADHVRQSQARMIQTERLAAASSIARKVVHEVNNPLGIVKNYIKIFGLKLPKDDPAQEELGIIGEELDRVALIIRGLSDFSEPVARQTEPVDINGLLSTLVKIMRDSFAKDSGVATHLELDKALPIVFSQKNSLKQVIINLIKNAVEAMPQGGNLYVTTHYVSRRLEEYGEKRSKDGLDFVEIKIRDDGPGIPEEIKPILFEPYATTKKGDHSGLGLSVAYNIIKELNGALTCESEKGVGTTFKIALPAGSSPID